MPNLIDHLAFRAKLEPGAVAIQTPEHQMNFAQLLRMVREVACKLRRTGVRPGQFVVTSIRAKQFDWVFTLALFHEAAMNCSSAGNDQLPQPLECDWMITDREPAPAFVDRSIHIGNDWLEAARVEYTPVERIDCGSEDVPVRVFLTSGTTGAKKAVAMTIAQIVGRARSVITARAPASSISMLGQTTAADFNSSMVCLLGGSPLYVAYTGKQAADLIGRFRLEGLFASPAQLAGLTKELEAGNEKLDSLRLVRTGGAAPSRALVAQIHARLTKNILCHYGSTEAGGMCCIRPGEAPEPSTVGFPYADVEVQVVDASGRKLPVGEIGAVRVRTKWMVDGYYKDPEQSARSFRDGWFHPGDLGHFSESGALVLDGRESERLNIGGAKVDPVALDEFLSDYPGVHDAAVFATEASLGEPRLAAAIVAQELLDIEAMRAALRERFGGAAMPSLFVRMERIPRNEMGKVNRSELARLLRRQAESPQASLSARNVIR